MKRGALGIYDLFQPPTEGAPVSDEKKLRAIQGELPHFYPCFTFKKMKIVGDAASANEEAADPEQRAEDNHRNKKINRLPSEISFNTDEVRLLEGKQAYQLQLCFRRSERQNPGSKAAKEYLTASS